MTAKDFTGISIKTSLANQIEEVMALPALKGRYKSKTDFINEAIRRRLEELQLQYKEA